MSDGTCDFFVLVTVTILMFVLGTFNGCAVERDSMRREAIKAGVAEWVADEDGSPKFQYKTPVEQK